MRNLKFSDAFKLSRIFKKLKIRPELIADMSFEQVGFMGFLQIVEDLHVAEDEITEFLADLKGITKEEMSDLDFDSLIDTFTELKEKPGIKRFLSSVSTLMK